MRQPDEVKRDFVQQWLTKADQDMRTSEFLLESGRLFPYHMCFHAQQAAEKYLKAYLTWHQIEFPKTHAIEKLLELVRLADAGLADSLLDTVALTPYGVEIRYPGDFDDVNAEEAEQAVRLAEKVREAVIKCLESVL